MPANHCIIDLEARHAAGDKWLLGPFRPDATGEHSRHLEIGYVNLDEVAKSDLFHAHTLSEEYFVVMSGRLRMRIDAAEVEVGPGQVLLVRPGAKHIMRAVDPGTRILLVKSPPGPN
jgi:mannose-6-phosphate isomerase-like protein (cupin superfamily)